MSFIIYVFCPFSRPESLEHVRDFSREEEIRTVHSVQIYCLCVLLYNKCVCKGGVWIKPVIDEWVCSSSTCVPTNCQCSSFCNCLLPFTKHICCFASMATTLTRWMCWRWLTGSLSAEAGRRRREHTSHKRLWLQSFPSHAWTAKKRCDTPRS